MLRKFKDGLSFGAGFAIAYLAISYIVSYLITPMLMESQIEKVNKSLSSDKSIGGIQQNNSFPDIDNQKPFHGLPVDEQIKKASVILITKYIPGSDGQVKAIIKKILKKDEGVSFKYDVGDEIPSSSYFPRKNTLYGDGTVVFYVGNPPSRRLSVTYQDDRIGGLGDMPIELLLKKCNDTKA